MTKRISCNVISSRILTNTKLALVPLIGRKNISNILPNRNLKHPTHPAKTYKIADFAHKIADFPTGLVFDYSV